jgi:hypothetical protein
MRQVTTPKLSSRNGRASASAARKCVPATPWFRMNFRAAVSMGRVRSVATTVGVNPAKARAV